MAAMLLAFAVGVVCIVLGISNMRGNISSLHSYHRNRVSEEDRIPFGKAVGRGMILIGCGVIVFSLLTAATLQTGQEVFTLLGTGVLMVTLVIGLAISFRAMIKYNGGIF